MTTYWKEILNSILSGIIAGVILLIFPQEKIVTFVGGQTQLTTFGLLLIIGCLYVISQNK